MPLEHRTHRILKSIKRLKASVRDAETDHRQTYGATHEQRNTERRSPPAHGLEKYETDRRAMERARRERTEANRTCPGPRKMARDQHPLGSARYDTNKRARDNAGRARPHRDGCIRIELSVTSELLSPTDCLTRCAALGSARFAESAKVRTRAPRGLHRYRRRRQRVMEQA
jgi:hypothetical protein